MTRKLEIELLSVLPQNKGLFDNELARRADPDDSLTPLEMHQALAAIKQHGYVEKSTQAPDEVTRRPYYELTELGKDVLKSLDPTR